MFGKKPSVRPHIDFMLKKARRKLWILRHVKRAGLKEADLLRIFNTVIRSTLEYAARSSEWEIKDPGELAQEGYLLHKTALLHKKRKLTYISLHLQKAS